MSVIDVGKSGVGIRNDLNALATPFAAWARSFRSIQPLPPVMASPPTFTVGASNAVSAITGAANGTVHISPSSAAVTYAGYGASATVASGYRNATTRFRRPRAVFEYSGRRLEVRIQSFFGRSFSTYVDDELVSKDFPSFVPVNSGNQLVLMDFGADTLTYKAMPEIAVVNGGTGYAAGDDIVLAGGTSTTPATLRVLTVSSGVVTGVAVKVQGSYSVTPSNAVAQASTTGSGTGATFTMYWGPARTTLKTRKIEFVFDNGCLYGGLNVDSNTRSTVVPASVYGPVYMSIGDSFTDSAYTDHAAGNFTEQIAFMLGLQSNRMVCAQGGRGWLAGVPLSSSRVDIIAAAPDMIFLPMGLNDELTTQNTTSLTAAVTTELNAYLTALPNVRIVVGAGILSNNAAYPTAIVNGVLAAQDQTRVRAINFTTLGFLGVFKGGSSAVDFLSTDNVHPSQAGHDYLAKAMAPTIAQMFLEMAP